MADEKGSFWSKALDFITNPLDSVLGFISQQQTNKSNQELSLQQQRWSEEMWNKNNEYNEPINQLKRLNEAGFDPVTASFAGGGQAVSSGSSAAPASPYAMIPNSDPMQAAGNFSSAISSARNLMQDAMFKRDTREFKVAEAERQVALLEKSIEGMQIDNATKSIALSFAGAERYSALMESRNRAILSAKQAKLADQEFDKVAYELHNILPATLKEIVSKTADNEAAAKVKAADFKYVTQLYENAILEADKIKADTAVSEQQGDLLAAQTEKTKQETAGVSDENKTKHYTAEMLRQDYKLYCDTYEDRVKQFSNQTKISNRDVKSYWIRCATGSVGDVGKAAGGFGVGSMIMKAVPK